LKSNSDQNGLHDKGRRDRAPGKGPKNQVGKNNQPGGNKNGRKDTGKFGAGKTRNQSSEGFNRKRLKGKKQLLGSGRIHKGRKNYLGVLWVRKDQISRGGGGVKTNAKKETDRPEKPKESTGRGQAIPDEEERGGGQSKSADS